MRSNAWLELAVGGGATLLLAATLMATTAGSASAVLAAVSVFGAIAVLVGVTWHSPGRPLGWANRVTLTRAALVATVAGTLVAPQWLAEHALLVAGLSLIALALDGADGWVARRTASVSAFGARFDMELDAFFIAVLCLAVLTLDKAGAWVVLIAAARYLFLAAMRAWPWLAAPLPPSFRRKLVCVLQIVALLLALLPVVAAQLAAVLLAVALAMLLASFAIDVAYLYSNRGAARPGRAPLAMRAGDKGHVPASGAADRPQGEQP